MSESSWNRKAASLFPEHWDAEDSILELFFVLLDEHAKAHASNDEDKLRKIYGFAEWCLGQNDAYNSAFLVFYESLFERVEVKSVIPWLSPELVRDLDALWDRKLPGDLLEKIRYETWKRRIKSRFGRPTGAKYPRTVFHTGEIHTL